MLQEICGLQAEALNVVGDPRPLFGEKFLALGLEQKVASAIPDKHSEPPSLLDQLFVYQSLVALEDGQRIHAVLGGNVADGGQGVALLEYAIEDHGDHAVAQLAVNRLIVVPLVHPAVQNFLLFRYRFVPFVMPSGRESPRNLLFAGSPSYSPPLAKSWGENVPT